MRVFISWSGEHSKSIAEELRGWLRFFFSSLDPWMSRHNIEKGARWGVELAKELESTQYGILCITEESRLAPWVLFEAGALSKALDEARVVPYLVGVEYSDLPAPLQQFNGAIANREDTRLFLTSIRSAVMASGEAALSEPEIDKLFIKLWPDLENKIASPITTPEAPRSAIPSTETSSVATSQPDETELSSPSAIETSDPWTDMFVAHSAKDYDRLIEAYERLKATEDREADRRIVDECVYQYLCFSLGHDSALEKLKQLIESNEGGGAPSFWAGSCYERSENYSKAIEAYEMAVERAITPQLRVDAQASRALCMFKSGERSEAIEYLLDVIPKAREKKSHLYNTLSRLYRMCGQHKLAAVGAEKALEDQPNDMDIRFNAAYGYSAEENEFSALSLLHYKTLLQIKQDNSAAWNNLGVQYHHLDTKGLAARAYKKAAELKNTLANANLAYRYMESGFYEEAKATLKEAQIEQVVHKNVGTAFAMLIEMQEKESEKLEQALVNAREQQGFITLFATSFFEASGTNPMFSGIWKSEDGTVVTITQSDKEANGEWTKSFTEYKLSGQVRNRGAFFKLLKNTYTTFTETGYGYMYLSNDGQYLFMMLIEAKQHQLLKLEITLPPEPAVEEDQT